MIEATAPGKLLICGEYAVLRGAPAIAVAAGVRARARILGAGPGDSTLEVRPGTSAWEFTLLPGGTVNWRAVPPGGQGRILESCLAIMSAGEPPVRVRDGLCITLDSSDFWTSPGPAPVKLGLGSSAAVTVALLAALLAASGRPAAGAGELFGLALRAHRHFQGGAGSGVDVLAAAAGGVVQMAGDPSSPDWRQLRWPAELDALALWTGGSASTTSMLLRFEDFAGREAARFGSHIEDLRAVAAAVAYAWDRGDAGNILTGLGAYDAALRRLDREAAIGIYSAGHERLAELARSHGALYKPSGAGGGDFGLAFAAGKDALHGLRAAAAREGILHIDVGDRVPGVVVGGDAQRI